MRLHAHKRYSYCTGTGTGTVQVPKATHAACAPPPPHDTDTTASQRGFSLLRTMGTGPTKMAGIANVGLEHNLELGQNMRAPSAMNHAASHSRRRHAVNSLGKKENKITVSHNRAWHAWIDSVCPATLGTTMPLTARQRYTMTLLGVPPPPISRDACVAQRYLSIAQGFANESIRSPWTVSIPADVARAGSGLGSRWHVLLQSLEYTSSNNLRLVLVDKGQPGVPYLSRRLCNLSSERCFFRPFDSCDSFAACDSTRSIGISEWNFPGHAQNVVRSGTVWHADVPAIFESKRTLLWWQAQIVMFFLQPKVSTLQLLDDAWLRGERRTGNRRALLKNFSTWPEMHPYVSMHVRWGDKCWKESKCRGVEDYVRAAQQLRQEFGVTRLVLSSEDPKATERIPAALGESWEVYWTEGVRFGDSLKAHLPVFNATGAKKEHHELSQRVKERIQNTSTSEAKQAFARDIATQSIINFFVSSAADYIICTPSSNWCRIYVKMACALQGRCPPTVFMDNWSWDFTMSASEGMKENAFRYYRGS